MKRIFVILVAVLITASLFAQAPEKMTYQAVVRDDNSTLITSTQVGIEINIYQEGSASETLVYTETQTPTTNANGLFSIEIGGQTGFDTITWANGPYFLETNIDVAGGTNYTITGVSQLLTVPYALHAKTAETISEHKYQIGDFAQGGIVFWLDETGEHGLVCAKTDQDGGSGVRWYAGTSGNTQAKGDGPYAGEANTAIIIAAQVAIGDDGNTYAARICNELQITESSKTYGDWYLPAKQELNLMCQNRETINATATANGGVAFVATYYWNSTEYSSSYTWAQDFSSGNQHGSSKSNTYRVRAVRAF
ncbi:MAG: DUF1566 domain-containing protein [Bacteroidales bacterium]|nr:DUF1566 domain-containing protein [Bacteroidales bacterium]